MGSRSGRTSLAIRAEVSSSGSALTETLAAPTAMRGEGGVGGKEGRSLSRHDWKATDKRTIAAHAIKISLSFSCVQKTQLFHADSFDIELVLSLIPDP